MSENINETVNNTNPMPIPVPNNAQTDTNDTTSLQEAQNTPSNVFDQILAKSVEAPGISHPSIFRKGTLIEIPDPENISASLKRSKSTNHKAPRATPRRTVAIAIRDDSQAESVIGWAVLKDLSAERDNVILLHVRQAANGIIGDLTTSNINKEDEERGKSHALLKRHAAPLKKIGFRVKGVSIRGVDIRGELVRKLLELKADILIVGHHESKSMKERIIGCKVAYLTENAPCPVLVVKRNDI